MSDIESQVEELRRSLGRESDGIRDEQQLAELRTRYFGRKAGLLSTRLKQLGKLPAEERTRAGKLLNAFKREAEGRLDELARELAQRAEAQRHGAAEFDLTLPGAAPRRGTRHPLTLVRDELEQVFLELGYAIAEGPEVDDDFHAFEALNVPKDHPARDMQDTLYVGPERMLRPHTSTVQIRVMERQEPPIQVIATGRCYRRDTPDLTHSPMFHQIEGLLVDEGISMAHLKGTLEHMCHRLFTPRTSIRLRPSYFPFTEPSAELDVSCFGCDGSGCALCKGTGWIELGGCGMVDPNVFAAVGIEAERWTGFAFGLGLERFAMLRHGIDNIRLFFENDQRFLAQFPALV